LHKSQPGGVVVTSWRAKFLILLALFQLGLTGSARADEASDKAAAAAAASVPAPSASRPKSSTAVTDLFAIAYSLSAVQDPSNWVVYSTVATYSYYKWVFRRSLDFSRANRETLLRELDKTSIDSSRRKSLLLEFDSNLAELELAIPAAEQAGANLDKLIKNITKPGGGQKFPNGLGDFQEFITWAQSPAGRRALATETGKKFQIKYFQYTKAMTADINAPVANMVRLTREAFPTATLETPQSRDHSNGVVTPGTFEKQTDFLHDRHPIPMSDILPMMKDYRKRCQTVAEAVAASEAQLKKDSSWLRFWTRGKNIRWPAIHAGGIGVGTGFSLWLYWSSEYERKQAELKREGTATDNAKSDFAYWVSSPAGVKALTPYYEIIRRALNENEDAIVEMFEKRLTEDEKAGIDLKKYIHETVNDPAFLVSIGGATMQVAKENQGDRVNESSFLTMLKNAKTDESVRKGFFESFNKQIIKTTANKLWSKLSVGNAGEKFAIGELRLILDRADKLLQDDTEIKQPPKDKEVPSAPGTATPAQLIPELKEPAEPVSSQSHPGTNDVVVMPVPNPMVDSGSGGTLPAGLR